MSDRTVENRLLEISRGENTQETWVVAADARREIELLRERLAEAQRELQELRGHPGSESMERPKRLRRTARRAAERAGGIFLEGGTVWVILYTHYDDWGFYGVFSNEESAKEGKRIVKEQNEDYDWRDIHIITSNMNEARD
jgi:hypothetical protein